jgi:hypothetical protein
VKKFLLLSLVLFTTMQIHAQQFTNKFLNDTLDMYTHWGIIRVIDTTNNDTTIYGIDFSIAGNATIYGTTTTDSVVSIGGWGYTGEHIVIPEASSNTNAGLGLYGMVNDTITAGKVIAGTYSRLLAMTANQPNQATLVGTESQFRLRDVDIADGVHAGLWAYAEQSGTSVLSGNGTFDAISATVESEAGFTVGATEHVTGITLDGSIHENATINASANYSAIYIKSNGKDWFNGIKITGVDNDIMLQHGETISNAIDGVTDLGVTNLHVSAYNFATASDVDQTNPDSIVIDFTPDLTLQAGLEIKFVAEAANTGACDVTLDGVLDNLFENSDGSELDANDIRNGQYVHIGFDGTQWKQISQSGN